MNQARGALSPVLAHLEPAFLSTPQVKTLLQLPGPSAMGRSQRLVVVLTDRPICSPGNGPKEASQNIKESEADSATSVPTVPVEYSSC